MYKLNKKLLFSLFLFLSTLVYSNLSFAYLSMENTSTYIGNGRWHWKIFINADRETLARIRCVEYTLHPTFPIPIERKCNRESNFALEANGWGTFVVKVRIFYTNNTMQNLEHLLVFEEKRTSSSFEELRAENWSRQIEPGWWEWGIYIKGPPDLLNKIHCVEYTLHPSFPNPVRTICTRSNNFEMKTKGWGTFAIPIKVLIKDGSVLYLNYKLHFD